MGVILPDTDETSAYQLADRLCKAVEGMRIPHEDGVVGCVTVSVGVVTMTSTYAYSQTRALVDVADQALYAAKHRERNRVVCANDSILDASQQASDTTHR